MEASVGLALVFAALGSGSVSLPMVGVGSVVLGLKAMRFAGRRVLDWLEVAATAHAYG